MMLKIEIDTEDPKAKEFCWFLGNCLEEWQKPEPLEEEKPIKMVTRKCSHCGLFSGTPQQRGNYVCVKCKEHNDLL